MQRLMETLESRLFLSTYVVTTLGDNEDPVNPTAGSLRAAINLANNNSGSTSDTITFDPSLTTTGPATIFLGSLLDPSPTYRLGSELTINKNITITGPGADKLTIDGNNYVGNFINRVFHITGAGTNATITGLTIHDGQDRTGGGIYNDPGATLNLVNCTMIGNQSFGYGNSGGGAIYNAGTLRLSNCTVTGNYAFNSTLGGGGISNVGKLSLTNCTLSNNSDLYGMYSVTGGGGGIYNGGTLTTLTNCTLSGNSSERGGGIANDTSSALTLTNCTVSGSLVDSNGGGILNYGTATLTNTTLSGNSSNYTILPYPLPGGGGIYNAATLVLNDCTVSDNAALFNNYGGGGIYNDAGTVTANNSIIAGNRGPGGVADDVAGTINSGSNNLIGGNPGLAPLGNYGGPTQTMALLPTSPAIDQGSNALALNASSDPLTTDQRGVPRIVNSTGTLPDTVDIGAYEAGPVITGTVYNALPTGSQNNTISAGGVTVNLRQNDANGPVVAQVTSAVDGTYSFSDSSSVTYAPGTYFVQAVPVTGTRVNNGYTIQLGSPDGVAYTGNDFVQSTPSTTLVAAIQAVVNYVASAGGNSTANPLLVTTNGDPTTLANFLTSIGTLSSPNNPVYITVNAGGASYKDTQVSVPKNVTLTLDGATFTGGSPALIVLSGNVIVTNCTLTNSTRAPTILVSGGHLTLRNDTILESDLYTQAAIQVDGGTVDMGTVAQPGNNTIQVRGTGQFVKNNTATPVSAVGDTFLADGSPVQQTLQGMSWVDFNNDGNVDFGEQGIDGIPVALTGTDDLGNKISLSTTTANGGIYTFGQIRPGTYSITEGPLPAAIASLYVEGKNAVGTVNGTADGDGTVQDVLGSVVVGVNGMGVNYNFGERPAPGAGVRKGQAAGTGFWQNKSGQALIKSFSLLNGSPELGNWLAATMPNVFGTYAGFSNTQVAQAYQQKFAFGDKLDAQLMATALNVYATNASLGGSSAASYGFAVGSYGLGDSTWNVGADGAAFGVANNSTLTVIQILQDWDQQANKGNTSLKKLALDTFNGINSKGGL
jgi:hypothetical protein